QSAAKLDSSSSSCCRGCSNRNSSNTVKGERSCGDAATW
ncbi:hypothetical protein TYRP_005877, partial [Tyrophagus putrescentiae]